MASSDQDISEQQCEDWRIAYRNGETPYQVSVESDVPRSVVHQHLTGECDHTLNTPSITGGRTHEVSNAECRDIRDRYANNESIESLQQRTGRRWKTLVKHLTGQCSHDQAVEAPTVQKHEILGRDHVSASECAQLRRGVREASSVLDYADGTDFDYQTVLAHVNGECTHDIEEPPRETNDRSRDISQSDCQDIRSRYRSGADVEFGTIAQEYDCSETTIERHVTFKCTHPPQDALVTEVDAVQDLLSPEPESGDGIRTVRTEDIVQLEAVESPDRKEPASDLANPDPDRVETTRSRVIRNTALTHDMKEMYDYECQVCGDTRKGPNGTKYAEAHHIRPLGQPHEGPDEPENILILCPNHHADFDYGRLVVDPETFRISHAYEDDVDGSTLFVADAHEPREDYLVYHNEAIAGE